MAANAATLRKPASSAPFGCLAGWLGRVVVAVAASGDESGRNNNAPNNRERLEMETFHFHFISSLHQASRWPGVFLLSVSSCRRQPGRRLRKRAGAIPLGPGLAASRRIARLIEPQVESEPAHTQWLPPGRPAECLFNWASGISIAGSTITVDCSEGLCGRRDEQLTLGGLRAARRRRRDTWRRSQAPTPKSSAHCCRRRLCRSTRRGRASEPPPAERQVKLSNRPDRSPIWLVGLVTVGTCSLAGRFRGASAKFVQSLAGRPAH